MNLTRALFSSDGEAPDGTAHDAEYPEYPGDQLQYKENDHGKGIGIICILIPDTV